MQENANQSTFQTWKIVWNASKLYFYTSKFPFGLKYKVSLNLSLVCKFIVRISVLECAGSRRTSQGPEALRADISLSFRWPPCPLHLPLDLLLCAIVGWATHQPMFWASLVVQMVKNPLAVHETWVQSLAWEDPLEKGMTAHSNILAWEIPWTEEPGRLQFMVLQKIWTQLSV